MIQTSEKVKEVFNIIDTALRTLHGRIVYDMFGLYLQELKYDIADLISRDMITQDLNPNSFGDLLILPNFRKPSPNRLRYMWDYFIFIYMSHKIQNIKRRQQDFDMPTVMYLRGSDYEFTISQDGAAVSSSTSSDIHFQVHVLRKLKKQFNILKALSPIDLRWIMIDIGPYLMAKGNTLGAVAEFARIRDEGVLLNAITWKKEVLDLFPSASVFLVYVSNRSNGLRYELESLLHQDLEAHSVLVLDPERSTARRSFYEAQDDLRAGGSNLQFSVARDACNVDDPVGFEHLLNRFPLKIEMDTNESALYDRIASLLQTARRQTENQPAEIPFKFGLNLNAAERTKVDDFRQFVSQQINEAFSSSYVLNWPALLLFIELDIFLSLSFGDISQASVSTARYAALAHGSAQYLKRTAPELFAEVGPMFEQQRNMSMNVALDAFSFGEWNDYRNRLIVSRRILDRTWLATSSLLFKSFNACNRSVMPMSRTADDGGDKTADYIDLLGRVLDSHKSNRRRTDLSANRQPGGGQSESGSG
jgi:hypothetical protein